MRPKHLLSIPRGKETCAEIGARKHHEQVTVLSMLRVEVPDELLIRAVSEAVENSFRESMISAAISISKAHANFSPWANHSSKSGSVTDSFTRAKSVHI